MVCAATVVGLIGRLDLEKDAVRQFRRCLPTCAPARRGGMPSMMKLRTFVIAAIADRPASTYFPRACMSRRSKDLALAGGDGGVLSISAVAPPPGLNRQAERRNVQQQDSLDLCAQHPA